MTPSQILLADHKRFGHGQDDTARLMQTIVGLVNKNAAKLIQHGDSLLFLIPIGKGSAEINFFTADSPQKIKSSMVYFIKQVKQAGFTKVYGENGGPILNKTLPLLEKLGLNVEKSDNSRYYWMAEL